MSIDVQREFHYLKRDEINGGKKDAMYLLVYDDENTCEGLIDTTHQKHTCRMWTLTECKPNTFLIDSTMRHFTKSPEISLPSLPISCAHVC